MKDNVIYTSYFAKLKEFDKSKFELISIARVTPKWISNIKVSKTLCPPWKIIEMHKSGHITNCEYEDMYLANIPNDIASVLEKFSERIYPKIAVLFCYESPDKFCHRHLLANYVNNKLGYELIKEYK